MVWIWSAFKYGDLLWERHGEFDLGADHFTFGKSQGYWIDPVIDLWVSVRSGVVLEDCIVCSEVSCRTGVPNPLGHGLVETGSHSRRWAVGEWANLHLYLQSLLITLITTYALSPVRSVALDFHRNTNPIRNCTCKGSRLLTPYENLMPDLSLSSITSDGTI